MKITFDILKSACRYNGEAYTDKGCCNHVANTDKEPAGLRTLQTYAVRSRQLCAEAICPLVVESMNNP